MAFKKKHITSVDIGSDSIKIITGQKLPENKIHLQNVHFCPFETGAYNKYGIDIQLEKLTNLLNEKKIKHNVNLCYSNPSLTPISLTLPDMPIEEYDKAIKWELSQKNKLNESQSVINYILSDVTYDPTSKHKKISIYIHNKYEVEKFSKLFDDHKIKVNVIEEPSFALINALIKFKNVSSNKAYLILNMGAAHVDLMVVHNFQLIFQRKLNLGGYSLTKSVSEYCKIDIENADKLKRDYGILMDVMSDNIIEAHHIITSSLEKLVSDIQYSIKYFSFQVTKSKITTFDKILLTGGFANMKGIREFFQERLSLDASIIDFKEHVTIPDNYKVKNNENPWPYLNTALGTMLWDKSDLNSYCSYIYPELYTKEMTQKSVTDTIKLGLGSMIVLSTILISLGLWILTDFQVTNTTIKNLTREANHLEILINEKKVNNEKLRKGFIALDNEKVALIDNKNNISSQLDAIKSFSSNSYSIAEIFIDLPKMIDKNLTIEKIRILDNALYIKGEAKEYLNITNFMNNINKHQHLKDCTFMYTNLNNYNQTEFEIKTSIKR